MSFHTGIGARPGVALAAAARLRVEYGVATFDPARLRRLAARLRAFGAESPETEQIILIVDSFQKANALPTGFSSVAGLEVIGLAVGADTPLVPPPDCPAVIGLGPEFFESVAEDEIVIVDGSRGRVYVAPDALTIARYQAPAARGRRIFLEGAHIPARTASDGGRTVAVYAAARTREDRDGAMNAGADGLVLPDDNRMVGGGADPMTTNEQAAALDDILQAIGGQPLLLHVPPEYLALSALARASAGGPLHLVVDDEETRAEIAGRLAEIEAVYEEDDVRFGTPQLELCLSTRPDDEDAPLPDTLDGFAGVFVPEAVSEANMERLLLIAGLARRTRRPLLLTLGDDWPAELPAALSLGASRLLVPTTAIPDLKDAIRAW